MNRCSLLLLVLFLFQQYGRAQELDEILGLHRSNLEDLYRSRGLPPEWAVTGEVSEQDILGLLSNLEGSGLLVYTWMNGNLDIKVFGPEGIVHSDLKKYEKEELTHLVAAASSHFPTSIGTYIRGSKVAVSKAEQEKSRQAFDRVSTELLPLDEVLLQFDHLIIVPGLNIGNLPFAAFPLKKDYLIDHISYSIAPSLMEFLALSHINRKKDLNSEFFKNALLVTNPDFSGYKDENFEALPGTVAEGEALKNLLEVDHYLHLQEGEATKNRILQEVCGRDLLYFATHGMASPLDPLNGSYLVLTGNEKKDFLTARDIQKLRNKCVLEAQLVVLSACQTGLGQEHGAGTIGLARAFQIAGAGQVLMSLWSVDDSQTSLLMKFFMEELKNRGKETAHTSLQAAIIRYKKQINKDPRFWASFSLFGVPYGF